MNIVMHKSVRKLLLGLKYWRLNRTLPAYNQSGRAEFTIPELQGTMPDLKGNQTAIYAACDNGYYLKFGRAFIGSIVTHGGDSPVHLHVVNPSQATLAELAQLQQQLRSNALSYTWETADIKHLSGEEPGIYYYSIRFWRMSQFVAASGCACLCLDVDALLQASATQLLVSLRESDIAFYSRFEKFGGNTKLLAGTLFVNSSTAGKDYVRAVGQQIHRYISAGVLLEKFDQQVLYAEFVRVKRRLPKLAFRSLRYPEIDLDFTAQGIVWYPKGKSKREQDYRIVEKAHRASVDALLEL